MKIIPLFFTSLLATALLAGCGGSSSGRDSAAPATAALSIAHTALKLIAGASEPRALVVTNTSSTVTVTAVHAALPADLSDVTQDASDCAELAPGAQCTLYFTPGAQAHAATPVKITGTNAQSTVVTLSVVTSMPVLVLTDSSLRLEAGAGTPASITVTNLSGTLAATGIAADLSGTPLAAAVLQDASNCENLAPQASCLLYFTPLNTAVSATIFPIAGDNTNTLSASIEIVLPTTATLSIAGSPLALQASFGTPASGTLTVTNTSPITATGIGAKIAGTALDGYLTQDASNCATLAPGASCTLTFTPADSGVGVIPVVIEGDNTAQIGAQIGITPPSWPTLMVSGSPLTLYTGGSTGNITITNQSSTLTAPPLAALLNGTALAGKVTETANTCGGGLAPNASCTLTFTPGTDAVAETEFALNGGTTMVVAKIKVLELAIGDLFQGGVLLQLPVGSTPGIVAAQARPSLPWAPAGFTNTTIVTGTTDGAANTADIIATIGAGTNYAAGHCDNVSVTDGGTDYDDWYLPAIDELDALVATAVGASVPGFPASTVFWSSTEATNTSAYLSGDGFPSYLSGKAVFYGVICVRKTL